MTTDNAATVIIGQRVLPEYESEFTSWQHELNETASHYPGFLGAEVTAPTSVQPDWVVVYRFDSIANVQAWINSASRQDRLAVGRTYLDGPQTQQVVGGSAKPADQLVTVVVSHRVGPDHVEEFLAWQDRLRLAESEFEGFRGSETFRPAERRELLAEGKRFHDFHLRTIDNSFGSWFAFDEHGREARPPSDFKTSVAVWVGLYPTVVFLTLVMSPLGMPLWLGLLIGNLLSSFAMSYATMPYYVNPLLNRWLRPPPEVSTARTNWRGFAIVVAAMAFWTVAIYLVTTQFWLLP
jgi:antibiotic biosynthesis monooxygenase (ABM) superfamily enzyme